MRLHPRLARHADAIAFTVAAALAVALLSLNAPGGPHAKSLAAQVCAPYVAMIERGKVIGAGTVIEVGGEKLILTAGHVVQEKAGTTPAIGEHRQFRTEGDPQPRDAELVAYTGPEDDEQAGDDLALLRPLDPAGLAAAQLPASPVAMERGEPVWYIGSPAGEVGHLELSIYSRDRETFGKPFYVVNGCGWHGNSGGGAYVKRGERYLLIGVLTRGYEGPYGAWVKGPCLLETQATIFRFLESYKSTRK